ncbi:MAG: hypothetical protein OHK0022_08910 [Roseiflexaceae bacterium]
MLGANADLKLVAALLELPQNQASELLRALLRRSLVEYDSARERWGMHDLVQAYALGLLVEAGEQRAALLRYARLVIVLIDQGDRRYLDGGAGVLEGLALFDRERSHLEAVRAWLRHRARNHCAAAAPEPVHRPGSAICQPAVSCAGAFRFGGCAMTGRSLPVGGMKPCPRGKKGAWGLPPHPPFTHPVGGMKPCLVIPQSDIHT